MTITNTSNNNSNNNNNEMMVDDDNKGEQYPVIVDVDNSSSKKDEEDINADNDDSIELGTTNIATTTTTTAGDNDNDNDDDNYVELVSANDDEDDADNLNSSNSNKCKCNYMNIKKIIIGLILLGLIIYVITDSLTTKNLQTIIIEFLNWVEQNPIYGVLAFVLVYIICTIFFIPGSILTLGAGFVFSASTSSLWTGVLLGTIAVFIGASIGAILSFLLGRYLFRDSISTKLITKYPVFTAIDTALNEKGLRIMILLRLSPIIPFNVLNYVSGITGMKLFDYCIACIGMLPGTILYVFLGSSAGSLSEIGGNDEEIDEIEENNDKTVTIIVIVVGIVFGILAVGVTSYYAKQELNKVIAQKEAEEELEAEEAEALEALEGSEQELEQAESQTNEATEAVIANEATPEVAATAVAEAAAVTAVRID